LKGRLKFSGVTLKRGGRLLFEDLDLDLVSGGRLHLSGPNGSGKSSLIRLAAGLLRAERGRIERSDVALSDDALALDAEQPLARALAFWAGLKGDPQRLPAALDALDLTRLAEVPVRLLSAGQRKRAALARVAASGAPLWLLDEPANALDADAIERLNAMIAGHVAAGGAVLAASHGPLGGTWQRLELGA
jgi:heme exporter protein A